MLMVASYSWTPLSTRLSSDPRIQTPHTLTKVVYGKYWSIDARTGARSNEASTYYVFIPSEPAVPDAKFPVIVQYHGGGFTGGSAYSGTPRTG